MTDTPAKREMTLAAAEWHHRHGTTPPEVLHALKGRMALHAKRADDGYREPTRDERRLRARYDRILAEHDAKVLDAFKAATLDDLRSVTAPTNDTQE